MPRPKYGDRKTTASGNQVVPIILGAFGLIPDDPERNLWKVGCTSLDPCLLQKGVLLATATIVRKVMDT